MFAVSQKAMHGRTIRARDKNIERGSVFPFFHREGLISWLMVIEERSANIYLVPREDGLATVPLFGAITLACDLKPHRLREGNRDLLQEVARTLHYDPWNVLAAPRFSSQKSAVKTLQATNCVDSATKELVAVWFRRDLSKIRWATVRDEEQSLVAWRMGLVNPPDTSEPRVPVTKPQWILDPFWL